MTFYGKPSVPNDQPEPMASYVFKDWGGREHTVKAHFLQFQPGHVTFWEEVADDNNRLVLAIANTKVNELREEE